MTYVIQDVVTGKCVKKTDGMTWPFMVPTEQDPDLRWGNMSDENVRHYHAVSDARGQLTGMIRRIEIDLEHYENGEWEKEILKLRRGQEAKQSPFTGIWKTAADYRNYCRGLEKHFEKLYMYGAEAAQRKHLVNYGLVVTSV